MIKVVRFDPDALRRLAGDTIFARGKRYHEDGLVRILLVEPGRVVAHVEGTEDYRVMATGRGKAIAGTCTCPAFERGFCKHLVAVALAANMAGDGAEAEGVDTLARIRVHLKEKGVDALIDMILGLAEQDMALFHKLELAASTRGTDGPKVEAQLRKALDRVTRVPDYMSYEEEEESGWAAEVETVLSTIADLASGPHAAVALSLAERAIDRIWRALGEMHSEVDSELLTQALDIHAKATDTLKPDPVQLARQLFARGMADEHDMFCGVLDLYARSLGETGIMQYRSLATAAWEKAQPQAKDNVSSETYNRLWRIMDGFAERDGDVDTRISMRVRKLSDRWTYLELIRFCISQQRDAEALRWAEEALWLFEDQRPDSQLLSLADDLLSKAGRSADMRVHLERAFAKRPDLAGYVRLCELGGEPMRVKLLADVEARIKDKPGASWSHSADFLIELHMHDNAFVAAWATVKRYGASLSTRERLAQGTEATHPAEALEVYIESVEHHVNNSRYHEAVIRIRRMEGLRGPLQQGAYVADLKERHKRKRNLMKLLDRHMYFPEDQIVAEQAEQDNQLLVRRQREFRLTADILTRAWMRFPEVRSIAVIGSVARPLRRQRTRFRKYRRLGIEMWNECHDLDLALWLDSQDRLGELRRVTAHRLGKAYKEGSGISFVSHQMDIFLFAPETDAYLGRLCSFSTCPKKKFDCYLPGCGDVPFNKSIPDFEPFPDLLEPVAYSRLYERGVGILRSALDLPGPIEDDDAADESSI